METKDFEKEFKKFCTNHDVYWDLVNRKWNKQFHNKLKTLWVKSEKGGFNKEKGECGYYQQVFDGFVLGPIPRDHCPYCLNKLEKDSRNPHKKFCNDRHRQEWFKIVKIREQLNAQMIRWSPKKVKPNETNSPFLEPQRKDMIVQFYDGTKRPLTKKKGKPRT